MGGFFGTVAKATSCVADLFYGTDYNSHLGTKRGGLATYDAETEKEEAEQQDTKNGVTRTELVHYYGGEFISLRGDVVARINEAYPALWNYNLERFAANQPKLNEEQNLASCAELVRAANANGGSNLLTELISQLPYDHPARMYYKSIEIAPEKTYGSILSSLQSKLGKFDSKEIAELTSTDTIDFEEIGNKKTAVYVISSDTHTAYDFLLTIFFSQMIQQLYDYADQNGGALKTPTYFILDEFANIGKIPDFDKKISTSRSRKISFSVILQNVDQLEAVYEKSYETIMGNCDTHVFLGSNSYKTVEYFSKALGEKTIDRDSISINRDKQNMKTGKSISDQVMARALMTPDELRRLDNDMCIIFEKGIKPVKAPKFYYFKHPMAKQMAACEISHNDIGEIERGTWRKYNPYNPYVEEKEENTQENLKVESLDDLFEDIDAPKKEEKSKKI